MGDLPEAKQATINPVRLLTPPLACVLVSTLAASIATVAPFSSFGTHHSISFSVHAAFLAALFGSFYWLLARMRLLQTGYAGQMERAYGERQWLQTTLRAIGDAVIATDEAGGIVFMNRQAELCTGWEEQDAIGRPLADVFHIINESTRQEVESPVTKVQRSGQVCGLANHTILIRKDGTELSIDDSGAPIRDAQGQIAGIILVFRNVSEEREVARALEASLIRFQVLAETVPALIFVSDAAGANTFVNRQFERYTGSSQERLLGNQWLQFIHPDDVKRARQAWGYAVGRGSVYEQEYRFRAATGEYRWFNVRAHPVKDDQGAVAQWFGACFDISARREAEDALLYERNRFRTLFELAPVGVAVSDAGDGRIVFANEELARITGYSVQELQGMTSQGLMHPEEPLENRSAYVDLRENAQLRHVETRRYLHKDGATVTVRIAIRVVTGQGAQQVLATIEDVTERMRAQQQLEESERRLTAFVDTIPTLAWMANADGWIFWYNRRWYEYTGTTPEQMEGWGWQSVHDPAVLPSVVERWTRSIHTGQPFEMVFPLRGADGVFRSFITRVTPTRDAEGKVTRWFGINTEVDELQRTREALQASEAGARQAQERIRVALKNIPLMLSNADRELRYTWVNRAHNNFSVEQFLGRRDDELLPADAIPGLIDFKRAVVENNAADRREFRILVDGALAVYDITAEPIHSADGEVTGITVAALDITERALAEGELREKSELIDLAQAAVNAGYWSYFPATGDCFLSPGEQVLFGLGSARPRVSEVLDRIDQQDRERVTAALEAALQTGVYFAEFRIRAADGATRWLAGQGRMLTRPDGETYMVGINFDVTKQKLAEEALRKNEKLAIAGRLAAAIAHEINNPLEAVTNLLYLVKLSSPAGEAREYVLKAEEELGRVSQIVTQSLRFHRQSTTPTRERLSTLLESAAGLYKSRMLAGQVELRCDFRDTAEVRCYASELRQVFGNFVGNALDAMNQGGILFLRTREARDHATGEAGVRILVADTGHGMDAATLQRIAEPFFTTKGANGTGLGLWISKDILHKHRATLRIRSRQGGNACGTVFSIFLPLRAIPEPAQRADGRDGTALPTRAEIQPPTVST